MRRPRIQTTTTIGLLGAGLLPLLVVLGLFGFSTLSELKEAALKDRSSLTRRLAVEVEGLLENVVLDVDLIRTNPLLVGRATDPDSRAAELSRMSLDTRFTEISLLDENGYVVATSDDVSVTQDRSPWFERCVEQSCTVVSDPIRKSEDELSVLVYEKVPDELESDIHVVRARMGFGSVWSILDGIGESGSGQMFLIDASGNILYSSDRTQIFRKSEEIFGDIPITALRGNGLNYENDLAVYIGHLVRPNLQLESEREWGLVWTDSKANLFSVLYATYHHLFLGASVGILSAVLLGLTIERQLSRPILSMCGIANRAAKGELGVRMSESGSRELYSLSATFNEMMDRLVENQAELEEQVQERTAELQETISQLRQSQKMEAVGLMAGGIAHDFNNLLTAINGNVSLAISANRDNLKYPETTEHLRQASTAGERAAGVVRQLLAFSRKEELQLKHEDINSLVTEIHGIVEHTFGPRIDIVPRLFENQLGIKADSNQIQQVLMNLCINAKDAMNEQGGVITLTTGVRTVSAKEDLERTPGDYVYVRVTDTGEGISKEHLDRIFVPFFTTKAPNKGSGLGLAMCYGIVSQHGGWIECESECGRGTTFTINLPLHEANEMQENAKDAQAGKGTKSARPDIKGVTVLVADDEPAVRAIAVAVLTRQGCNVITADNGQEALALCADRSNNISVVMLDGAMPILSGQEAFAVIARDYPDLPVIICSGNISDDESYRSPEGRIPDAFILKPYHFDQLVGEVETLVDARVAS
ncbi:MAG: signal transduction histidine kinase [Verrucomicrobiales bacterium]|jgi:signal transduction histidine kinase